MTWVAALLTVIALGAVASHLKIGSPLTALPALAYAAVQVWFIAASRANTPRPEDPAWRELGQLYGENARLS